MHDSGDMVIPSRVNRLMVCLRCPVASNNSKRSFSGKSFKESSSNGSSVFRCLSTWAVVYMSRRFLRTGTPVDGSQKGVGLQY